MELTLALPPAEASGLNRLPLIASARTGRAIAKAARIVWHDDPERSLAGRGLSLTEEHGTWRLRRDRPASDEAWPPGTDHRLLEEAASPAALTHEALAHALPAGLAEAARFEGKRTVSTLAIEGMPLTTTLLTGVLRGMGAAERPVARLTLEGSDAAVRALAAGLADSPRLEVPIHGLGPEATRPADNALLPPRRKGAPVLPSRGLTTHAAFAHILGHLTDVMLSLAARVADPATGPEPVHQMRVAVRRARSALSLFRPLLGDPDLRGAAEGLRQLGRQLGPARDWDVFATETLPPVEAALDGQADLGALPRIVARRREAARATLSAWLAGPDFRRLGVALACLAAADPPAGEMPPLDAFATAVLRKRWKRMRDTGKTLEHLDHPALHDFRLKAKRLRYAAEFFASLFPEKPTARFLRRLSGLQEHLGTFNDTAVAGALLRELNGKPGFPGGLVLGFAAARAAGIRPRIEEAWEKLRRQEGFW